MSKSEIRNAAECDQAANVHRHEMLRERETFEASGAILLCADCDKPALPRSCYCQKCEDTIYGVE